MSNLNKQLRKILFFFSPNQSTNFLRFKPYHLERDIYKVASIVFNIESAVKWGYNLKEVEIEITNETYAGWDIKLIEQELEELINLILVRNIKIKIIKKDTNKRRWNKKITFTPKNNLCLFSGGVDSTSGILQARKEFRELAGFFSAHSDQARIIKIVENLKKKINQEQEIPFYTVHVPPMFSIGYSQLRGFLYIITASIYANLLHSKQILVTECGPTMYQSRFSPFDTVTMTTHPFVLNKAKKLIKLFLGKNIELVLPYEDLTKSQLVSLSPLPELFPFTHSCISQRFGQHDGTCYGCVVRRIAFITAGIKDTRYTNNPLTNESSNADHLLSLARFSIDVLTNYENMEDYMKENIDEFNKIDLFKRFSQDFFAGIHLLKNEGEEVTPAVETFYEDALKAVGKDSIENHIGFIRDKKYKPAFSKTV